MHAVAHHQAQAEPDMFADSLPGDSPARPAAPAAIEHAPCMQFDGTVLRQAEVRNRPAKDGLHSVPVVCIELQSTVKNALGTYNTARAEVPFTDATRAQAEALAKSLARKRVVTLTAPLGGMAITFHHVSSIHLHPA